MMFYLNELNEAIFFQVLSLCRALRVARPNLIFKYISNISCSIHLVPLLI